ncbi:hypothetical protein [Microcoleus sp. CAWBG58]|uniref:hypothetical protein n=1 Tax=Microcoleus sp. CAWBG58 TaxID=2841651 RepID=UPI0025E06232|nr:hypothetical protein [Microcoleus sp. CAWBG58]
MEEEEEIDLQLQRLAIEAQSHPIRSRERNRALNSLIREIQRCPRIARPSIDSHLRHSYEDIYNEALARTFEHICQRIDTYDSQNPVMAWVNYFFKLRFKDVSRERMKEIKNVESLSLEDLEHKAIQRSQLEMEDTEIFRELIEQDPDEIFRNKSVRGRPDITLQEVILARMDDATWENIGDRFGISPQTASSFFQRSLRDRTDYIRNKLQ